MIAVGKMADAWGRKRVFYTGVLLFAIAALAAGLSTTIEMLIFFRALQALGSSTIFILSSALLTDIFPENERVRAISIYGGVTGFGLMIGPFLGGVLIELLNWRWVFWINLPLIALGLGAARISVSNATSFQVAPPEAGVNHFNTLQSDACWAFAAQIKTGLRYNFCRCFHLFGEYRYMFVDFSNYILGSTLYPNHAHTTPWNVKIDNMQYNAFVIGIQYDL